MCKLLCFICLLAISFFSHALPNDFVYLNQIVPDVIEDIRYAGNNNFIGNTIPGYQAAKCILTRQAAEQLKKIQMKAKAMGYSLKVFDCYRPQMAVDSFIRWSKTSNSKMKARFYPNEDKNVLFAKGYLAEHSGHTRGSTIDLTLVQINNKNGRQTTTELDMGTPYDYLDKKANVFYPKLTPIQRTNRQLLRRLMLSNGFKPYPQEWWHFTLRNEPYPHKYFNFQVQ